jgi:NTE family protein
MFDNKKIGLALSGGGALGAAHIGAIEELEKAGIRIDYISGVSSGAIIGLAYAAGGLDSLHNFYDAALTNLAKKDKFVFAKGPDAVFGYIKRALEDICRGKDFSQMAIPFSCLATNLATGEREVFISGNPVASVLASSAYPGFFAAQKLNGKFYIDGGVTRNLPVDEVRMTGADFVISSSSYVVDRITDEKAGGMGRFEAAARALDILEKELCRFEEKRGDFCFKPPVAQYHWFDFFKMEEILEQGRANAAAQIKDLLPLLKQTSDIAKISGR